MNTSSSSSFATPPCSPQARCKKNSWFQEGANVCQSPPSVGRKTRIHSMCESPSPATLSKRGGRRLAFEQSSGGKGEPASPQLRLHSSEGVEELKEGWITPARMRIQAACECPPAPRKPARRSHGLKLSTAARRIDFETAATVFSFNSRRRVMVEEPQSDSGSEGEPPNRRQRCGEEGWRERESAFGNGSSSGEEEDGSYSWAKQEERREGATGEWLSLSPLLPSSPQRQES